MGWMLADWLEGRIPTEALANHVPYLTILNFKWLRENGENCEQIETI
jgi:hypothetical protein